VKKIAEARSLRRYLKTRAAKTKKAVSDSIVVSYYSDIYGSYRSIQ
jgi:hypothetical protein